MILIISDRADLQVYWVTYYLKKWGMSYAQLNVADYPLQIKQRSKWEKEGYSEEWVLPDGRRIDNKKVTSVWYRKPDLPKIMESLGTCEKEYAYNESRQGLQGFYHALRDCFWISPIYNMTRAGNKPLQLGLASDLGFLIPETIVTNDPEEAWRFHQAREGKVVYKTLSEGILAVRGGAWEQPIIQGEIYTTPLEGYRRADFERVAQCPCLFQEYVEKRFELRITVVGDKVFAAEIHSQASEATRYDWRRDELNEVPHAIHALPEAMAQKCVSLVAKLGLQYGAIDMIYTPEGEYVFLEINPNGQYGWIEQRTGLPISEAIAKALAENGKRASKGVGGRDD